MREGLFATPSAPLSVNKNPNPGYHTLSFIPWGFEESRMSLQQYFIVLSDNTVLVASFDPVTRDRKIYGLTNWLHAEQPAPAVDSAEAWLEANGPAVDSVYAIEPGTRTVSFNAKHLLEYAELIDEMKLY